MGDMAEMFDLDPDFDEHEQWCEDETCCPGGDTWVTADRQVFKIKDLKTSHLCNILNFIARECPKKFAGTEKLKLLKAEAKKRGIKREGGVKGLWRDVSDFIETKLGSPKWSAPAEPKEPAPANYDILGISKH